MKFWYIVALSILFVGCKSEQTTEEKVIVGEEPTHAEETSSDKEESLLDQGLWIGYLRINDVDRIPFNMEVVKDSVYFVNADERIGGVVQQNGEILQIKMPIFDSEFQFSVTEQGMFGFWHNYAKSDNYKIPYVAKKVDEESYSNRFFVAESMDYRTFEGQWETTFDVGSVDEYKALGLINQVGQDVTGTFLTETGDYRFLQGNATGDSLYLSAFDGSHAFMFKAKMEGEELNGTFYSGNHYQNNWEAKINNDFELTDPDSLTKIKVGKELEFSFPGLDGKMVSYPSPKYTDKVVIVQILGSWCPNCMDETKFLTNLHKSYKKKGVEVIGICYENPETLDGKIERVKELKEYFGSEYTFCIGGNASKKEATESIPSMSEIISFPTTLYIDKSGIVRKIHTGFNGPSTGSYYMKFVDKTIKLMEKMVNE